MLPIGIQSTVLSPVCCHVSAIDSMEVGLAAVTLGAGRATAEEAVDFTAGIILREKVGKVLRVNVGDVLAEVYTDREGVLEDAAQRVLSAFSFSEGEKEVSSPPLITHVVTKDGVEEFDQSVLAAL